MQPAIKIRLIITSTLIALLGGCSTLTPRGLQNSTTWQVTQSSNTKPDCTLSSSPLTYTTLAGGDKLTISIKNNNIVSLEVDFEDLTHINLGATSIHVDEHPPIYEPSSSTDIHELRFSKEKSLKLINQLKNGSLAYVKLALPKQSRPITARLSLGGFHKALLELRMCNIYNTKKQ